jgi:hypothetical protein
LPLVLLGVFSSLLSTPWPHQREKGAQLGQGFSVHSREDALTRLGGRHGLACQHEAGCEPRCPAKAQVQLLTWEAPREREIGPVSGQQQEGDHSCCHKDDKPSDGREGPHCGRVHAIMGCMGCMADGGRQLPLSPDPGAIETWRSRGRQSARSIGLLPEQRREGNLHQFGWFGDSRWVVCDRSRQPCGSIESWSLLAERGEQRHQQQLEQLELLQHAGPRPCWPMHAAPAFAGRVGSWRSIKRACLPADIPGASASF